MTDLSALLSPVEVAGLSLRNRVVMAPMTRSHSPGGIPNEANAAYYARRAAAGVGLIVTEGVAIDRPGASDDPDEPLVPRFHGEAALAGWGVVADAVHGAGGCIFPQLWHVGATVSRRAQWHDGDARIESPSALSAPNKPLGRAMTDVDLADTIAAYADAAAAAERLGFDGVEVHGAHGYLIDQFFWPATNARSDRFGGATIGERTRFAVEIVAAIRRAVSPGFPVAFRFSQFKQQDYQIRLAGDPQALGAWLGPLASAGVDIFHASQRRFWDAEFPGSPLNLAGWARKVTGRPAITVGSVGLTGEFRANWSGEVSEPASLDSLLERLERDEFDLVAVGRALLNDPEWLAKIAEGRLDALQPFTIDALDRYA